MKTTPFKINTVTSLLFLLTVSPFFGQTVKKVTLTSADYSQWHKMDNEKLSDDGKWVSYTMNYERDCDTTFVKEIKSKYKSSFPQSHATMFKGNWFSCLQDDKLHLLNLHSKKKNIIPNVGHYAFAANDQIVLSVKENDLDFVIIRNKDAKETQRFENATHFYLDPSGREMMLLQSVNNSTKLSIINLISGASEIIKASLTTVISNVTWADNGKAIAFLNTSDSTQTIFLYRIPSKQLLHLQVDETWKSEVVSGISMMALLEHENQLLFWTQKKQSKEEHPEVNIWNAQDHVVQLNRKKYGSTPRTFCKWWINSGVTQVFDDKDFFAIGPNGTFAIRRDDKPYRPAAKSVSDSDYYFVDLNSGKEELILRAYDASRSLMLLPDGKSMLYFKKSNWWRYTFETATHENLTMQLPVSFVNDMLEKMDPNYPAAPPVIADNGTTILLSDTNDIWKLNLQGKNPIRLTKGKENNLIYRIAEVNLIIKEESNWIMNKPAEYKKIQPLLLKIVAEDYSEYGFGWLKNEKTISDVRMYTMRINIKTREKGPAHFLFSEESFDTPPRLVYWDSKKVKANKIVQSNPQYEKYSWGKSEFVSYNNSAGKSLKGVLFYPASFDTQRKYPMIVSIYEKQGYSRYLYTNPTVFNTTGFNVTNLTNKGYFVFLPDITYERNNPGYSALDCVMAAVNAAIANKSIDQKNVGLIGHSFGGYETNFIITQTPFFKTAISGAGITDLTSRYFGLSENSLEPETRRFEYGQYRMAGSIFKNRENYRHNSPIEYIENVTTPLLTWTGEKDTQVNPFQTMEFYIALRRLEKPHIMLTYPDEGHVILAPDRQIDLTLKIEEWFDYHLKNGVKKAWMNINFQYKRE